MDKTGRAAQMAKTATMPAKLIALAALNPDKVQSLDIERDEWDSPSSPWSYWMWLKPGWSPDGEVHCIHEPSIKEFMKVWKRVERCECPQCREASTV